MKPSPQYHLMVFRLKNETLMNLLANREGKTFRRIPYDESIYIMHGAFIKLDDDELKNYGSFKLESGFDFREL